MIVLGYNGHTNAADTFARLYGSTGVDRYNVLGHDAAAAVIVDGRLVAAVEEERLNREKKTAKFPVNAVQWCLDYAGLSFDEIDAFAFPWNYSDSLVNSIIADLSASGLGPEAKLDRLRRFGELYTNVFSRTAILNDFKQRTGYEVPAEKLMLVPHHIAHLMCGHYFEGGRDTAFLVSDGRAERFSSMMGEIRDGEIRVFEESTIGATHSLGLLFSEITRYLGFMPNNDEYKVMGLSAFAPPLPNNPLLERVVTLLPDGGYTFALANDPRNPHAAYYPLFDEIFQATEANREELDFRARVARAAQEMIEVVTAHQLKALQAKSDLPTLVFEGGLALNCVNNTKLLEESGFTDMQVSFGASDPGVSIGAAVFASGLAGHRNENAPTPYLGPEYTDEQMLAALGDYQDRLHWVAIEPEDVADRVAKLLCEKTVIGWFQGRTEYGPRALGNRSILANPSFDDIKDIINTRVKHREPFRPFAPVILESEAAKIFQMGKKETSPFMTFVFPVAADQQEAIPGAVHVDGTSRVQTVTAEQNPLLAGLLTAFTQLSGVPCLLNTSFNVAGEPIVSSPTDAIECFLKTEIDYLVLGRFQVSKV
ncbi:MAG TPA: carbamoyltransferase C-terminal domain-containing protein [Jatrophihabitans sp.]|uniref:carbamoyltransferase family protein n=1 Tax=Jatrophihabitans sp. TaxID=1932789 RepID=UPI002EE2D48F